MIVRTASIVVIGDDVVGGRRRDANGARIGQWLEQRGWELASRTIVPSRRAAIADAVRASLAASVDLVIIAGGLGPSPAEQGREGIAEALGTDLEFDRGAWAGVEAWYRERSLELPDGADRLALRPAAGEIAPNPAGPTPGFLIERGRTLLAAMPAVTRELEAMLERSLAPRLRQRSGGMVGASSAALRVAGLTESELRERAAPVTQSHPEAPIAVTAEDGEFEVRVTVRGETDDEARERLAPIVADLEERLGSHVIGRGDETIVGALARELAARGWTLGAAEAITGGLVAKRIVDQAGAGRFFVGAIVPYGDSQKSRLLDLSEEVLERCGAASAAAARAMAEGARRRLDADVAVSTTGIAGPQGGGEDRPVGLVFIGLASPDGVAVRRHVFTGDRSAVRSHAASMALEQTRRFVAGRPLLGESAEDDPCRS